MKTTSAKKKASAKRPVPRPSRAENSPVILFPTEKSTIGRDKIQRAVKDVISRRSS
jgi:hypothetical protein